MILILLKCKDFGLGIQWPGSNIEHLAIEQKQLFREWVRVLGPRLRRSLASLPPQKLAAWSNPQNLAAHPEPYAKKHVTM